MDNIDNTLITKESMDSTIFVNMVNNGMLNLKKHYKEVNDLNVFPVPDGDTGTNMRRTIETGFDIIKDEAGLPLYKVAQDLAKGMLLGARGNSGVILSQIFRGFAKGLDNKKMVLAFGLNRAFKFAVTQAYEAVLKPVEGTILTVLRESVNTTSKILHNNIYSYINTLYNESVKVLAKTKEMLPVLAEADVVDSGGAGLVYIFEGFKLYLEGVFLYESGGESISSNKIVENSQESYQPAVDLSAFDENSELNYGYCTEFMLQLQSSKVDINTFNENEVVNYLQTKGDSIVCFRDGTVIKTHVHTKNPGVILSYVRKWGEFLTVKIENMSLQHNQIIKEKNVKKVKVKNLKSKHKENAVVAVCQGAGIKQTYLDLGVDYVIDGKQTMNPSTKDFVKAFESIDAKNIYVLPNNSNIILTAEQASKLFLEDNPEVNIKVIRTKNVAQGYLAASLLSFGVQDEQTVLEDINLALEASTSIEVTYAIRDTKIFGIDVKKGDYISIKNGEVVCDNSSKIDCLMQTIEKIDAINEKELFFIIYGKNVKKEEIKQTRETIINKYPSLEFQEIEGGQDIYNYIVLIS